MDFGRDRKIVNHVAGQSRVTDSPHGVQTAADADQRVHLTLATLQEFFVPPVGTTSTAHRRSRRLHVNRSEEHTSELQSLRHLVCRLLLEKNKKTNMNRRSLHKLFLSSYSMCCSHSIVFALRSSFKSPPTTIIYTLSLHDALPIWRTNSR